MAGDGQLIRDATVDDAWRLAEVHVASWQHAYRGIVPAEHLDNLSVSDRAERWRSIVEAGSATRVMEVDGVMAGFASIGVARDADLAASNAGELYSIYLAPGAMGRGLGHVLLAEGVERLRERGFELGVLWVLEANARARRFYEREGWSLDGGRKLETFDGVELAEVRYRTALVDQ